MATRSSSSVNRNIKYIIHTKGHYGIEDPEFKIKFSKKGPQEDSYQRTKVQKAKVQNSMGMRNKRIILFTFWHNPVVSKL